MKKIQDASFGYRFAMLHRLQMSMCRKDILDHGLMPSLLPFVVRLVYEEAPVTQDELSEALAIDKGTTARALFQLEKKGYVTRKTNPENRRQNLVSATAKAYKSAGLLLASLNRASDTFVQGFTTQEKEIVLNLLDRMLSNAQNELHHKSTQNLK